MRGDPSYTGQMAVDDEVVYFNVAGECPKGRVYDLGSLGRKKRRYADLGLSQSQPPPPPPPPPPHEQQQPPQINPADPPQQQDNGMLAPQGVVGGGAGDGAGPMAAIFRDSIVIPSLIVEEIAAPNWGAASIQLLESCIFAVVESKTGASFPTVLGVSRRLLGIGLRKKSVLGLKNIDVYAFGVYADEANIKNMLNEKYDKLSVSELKGNKQFYEDVIDNDISMTVRLQIVYGRLSIGSVRSAFEESIGSRLQKFGGADNKELLQRFTSMFKDEYKIPRGSVIELSREPKHVLRATIDGKEIGSIQSKLLCRSVLDLYIGEDPFDKRAKEDVEANLASLAR
ncbi:hypothetical protein Scep_009470 [Stephania cephalantha]|uniref:Chalcone isomerase domain-containing protein n=1 Tax=Stephania cephalantha TaxID=152367 RepID=A0AAP0JU20_9MAGN